MLGGARVPDSHSRRQELAHRRHGDVRILEVCRLFALASSDGRPCNRMPAQRAGHMRYARDRDNGWNDNFKLHHAMEPWTRGTCTVRHRDVPLCCGLVGSRMPAREGSSFRPIFFFGALEGRPGARPATIAGGIEFLPPLRNDKLKESCRQTGTPAMRLSPIRRRREFARRGAPTWARAVRERPRPSGSNLSILTGVPNGDVTARIPLAHRGVIARSLQARFSSMFIAFATVRPRVEAARGNALHFQAS